MLYTILGFRELDFIASDGKQVIGTQFFGKFKDPDVIGEKTDKLFVRPEIDLPPNLKVGDIIDVSYNNRGKVESIRATKA